MRSHYCGEINEALVGQEVEVCGWVPAGVTMAA